MSIARRIGLSFAALLIVIPFMGILLSASDLNEAFDGVPVTPTMCIDARQARLEAAGDVPQDVVDQVLWRYVAQYHDYAGSSFRWHIRTGLNLTVVKMLLTPGERRRLYQPIRRRMRLCPSLRSKSDA